MSHKEFNLAGLNFLMSKLKTQHGQFKNLSDNMRVIAERSEAKNGESNFSRMYHFFVSRNLNPRLESLEKLEPILAQLFENKMKFVGFENALQRDVALEITDLTKCPIDQLVIDTKALLDNKEVNRAMETLIYFSSSTEEILKYRLLSQFHSNHLARYVLNYVEDADIIEFIENGKNNKLLSILVDENIFSDNINSHFERHGAIVIRCNKKSSGIWLFMDHVGPSYSCSSIDQIKNLVRQRG